MSQQPQPDRAESVVPGPTLRVVGDDAASGRIITLDKESATLGRRESNDYVLADPSVSRVHARITRETDSVVIADLGSSGGTKVNDTPITGSTVVRHGDQITFGNTTVVFEDPTQMDLGNPTEVLQIPEVDSGPSLSPRQQQVLELMAEGMTNSDIGDELGITERTVKAYASELYGKLDAANRAGAVAQGIKHGLL